MDDKMMNRENATQHDRTRFVRFIWGERTEPFCEVAPAVNQRRPLCYDDAVALVDRGDAVFFAPVRRALHASTRSAVAGSYDVVWVDIDSPSALDILEERLDPAIWPSAIVASGTAGHMHCYWKLGADQEIERIETLNKGLAQALDGDGACWNRDRLLRVPDSMNAKTGQPAQLVSLTGQVFDVQCLEPLEYRPSRPRTHREDGLQKADPDNRLRTGDDRLRNVDLDDSLEEGQPHDGLRKGQLPWREPHLPYDLWKYVHPRRAEKDEELKVPRRSRSETEAAIAGVLCMDGLSDEQIIGYFDRHEIPKHTEETRRKPSDPNRWLNRTLAKVRQSLHKNGTITFAEGGWPKAADAQHRWFPEKRVLEKGLVSGQTRIELRRSIEVTFGVNKRHANRIILRLIKPGLVKLRKGRVFADAGGEQ